jgi:hypothetical protein
MFGFIKKPRDYNIEAKRVTENFSTHLLEFAKREIEHAVKKGELSTTIYLDLGTQSFHFTETVKIMADQNTVDGYKDFNREETINVTREMVYKLADQLREEGFEVEVEDPYARNRLYVRGYYVRVNWETEQDKEIAVLREKIERLERELSDANDETMLREKDLKTKDTIILDLREENENLQKKYDILKGEYAKYQVSCDLSGTLFGSCIEPVEGEPEPDE